jgi:gliding motility-associated-like protein
MLKQKIVLFLLFVCAIQQLLSQTASQTSGCAPLQVNFTAAPGATSANWNFGNGTSAMLNPSNVFNSPGTYNVSYSGVGGNPTSGVIVITVAANTVNPAFSFTIPPIHCAPMQVSFSGTGGSPGSIFQWAFGDGGLGSGNSLNYLFTLGGVFNVTLAVTDPAGCTGTVTNGPIIVSNLPVPNIGVPGGLNSCQAPFTPVFSGSLSTSGSPLGGGLTYNWNFGNSQTSTQMDPGPITYGAQGYYNVSLSVTDNNNCSNVATAVVSVVQPTLSVTVPGTVCVAGQDAAGATSLVVAPTVQSSQPFTTWQMGDGNTIIIPPPPAQGVPGQTYFVSYPNYTSAGLKTLTITASIGNCVATVTKSIFVTEVTPQFTWTAPSFTCMPSMIASWINLSTVNSSVSMIYQWNVNAWNSSPITSTLTNPTMTLTEASLNPYAWYGMYIVHPVLSVTSTAGPGMRACKANITHVTDTMWRPTAIFNKTKREGCEPLTVVFRDTSDVPNLPPYVNYPMTTYTWNSGTSPATIITGAVPPPVQTPTFTYLSPGTYTPFFAFTTVSGCSAVSFVDTIIVVSQPTVGISFPSNLNTCVGVPIQFSLTASPSSSLIQHWHLQSDEGYFSGCVSDSMPTWPFMHPGVHGFTVSAYQHSCKSVYSPTQTITVKGPVVGGKFITNCSSRKSVDFSVSLEEVQTATLNFGDGNFVTIPGNPTGVVNDIKTHVYALTGDYTATLTGVNPGTGCASSTHTMLVRVRDINASFVVTNTAVCRGQGTAFDASLSVDVYTTNIRGYAWKVDNYPTQQTSFTNYTTTVASMVSGTHTVTLWVKDLNSCTSTMTKTFVVGSPVASFTFVNPSCLSNMPLQLVNTTTMSPVPAYSFTWNFGTTPPAILITNTVSAWPVFSYLVPNPPTQTYEITLIAVGVYTTCPDTVKKTVTIISPPDAYLYPYELYPCINSPALFNPPSPGVTYTVDFGDGSPAAVASTSTIAHTYTSTGYFSPVLTTGYGGCQSFSPPNPVVVQPIPVTDFTMYPTGNPAASGTIFCAPVSITFSSTSMPNGPAYNWNLGTGSPVTSSPTVGTIFTAAGIYTVTLRSYSVNPSCASSITRTLAVLAPTANIAINKPKFCLGETIRVHMLDTNNVLGWNWYFGDGANTGTVLANSMPTQTLSYPYQYFPPPFGIAVINLVYFSSGYLCPSTATLGIQVTKVSADFNRNMELAAGDSVHCLNIIDQFINKSKLNNSTFVPTLMYSWDFGNGTVSTATNPTYIYPVPGIYSVTLTVTEPLVNCKNVSVKNMTINPIPDVSIFITDSVCKGSNLILNSVSSGSIAEYKWSPVAGLSNPNSATTSVIADQSVSFSLTVTNIFGCRNKSSAEYVYVQQPAPSYNWDTTVIIGQPINLNSNLGTNYTYTWSPLIDLSCANCFNPFSTTTVNTTYSLEVEDNMQCFRVINTYTIFIDPQTSVDVPTAFTPNGDGVNDVIYVDGWGIKKLNYFRIFNRWGQLLFESNDIKIGWDGNYNGVPQNMETYVYQVSAETYIPEKSLQKASSFRLIR